MLVFNITSAPAYQYQVYNFTELCVGKRKSYPLAIQYGMHFTMTADFVIGDGEMT
jgi:hypothetical protein